MFQLYNPTDILWRKKICEQYKYWAGKPFPKHFIGKKLQRVSPKTSLLPKTFPQNSFDSQESKQPIIYKGLNAKWRFNSRMKTEVISDFYFQLWSMFLNFHFIMYACNIFWHHKTQSKMMNCPEIPRELVLICMWIPKESIGIPVNGVTTKKSWNDLTLIIKLEFIGHCTSVSLMPWQNPLYLTSESVKEKNVLLESSAGCKIK